MSKTRRSFLKFILGAGAGVTASPVLFKLVDDVSIWTQNWSWIPRNPEGATTYEPTTSKLCPSASGLRVRLVGGRPVRSLPNPEHPLGGGLSPLAAAETQLMYSPARVKAPLRRSSDGAYVRTTWDEAMTLLEDGLKSAGASLAAVSGDETGSSLELLSAFLKSRGSQDFYLMPSEMQAAARAWETMGREGRIGYDLEGCDYVLAIGANVLESWGTFVRNRRLFAESRPHGEAAVCSLVYAGPVQTGSAAVADRWVGLRPGGETALALGLAALLVQRGLDFSSPAYFKDMLAEFTPEKVEGLTGVSPDTLKNLADALLAAKKPAVLTASAFGQGGGAAPVMAGIVLNVLLQSDVLKGLPESPTLTEGAEGKSAIFRRDLASYLAGGPKPKAMIFYEANPVYALPAPKKTAEALGAIPFKVSFSAFMDETASLCDLVLPMPLGLERLDDIETPYGCGKVFYALSRKTMEPVVNARHGMDVLLEVSARLGKSFYDSYEDLLRAKAAHLGADWDELAAGGVFEQDAPVSPGMITLPAEQLAAAAGRKSAEAALSLAPIQKMALGTAQTGIPPFNVKTIRAGELAGSEMGVFMNGATAASRGLKGGDRVVLSAAGNEIRGRLQIYEGIVSDAVGVNLGFGHTALDAFSQNKGANVAELFTAVQESGTGLSVWSQTGVSVTKA